MNKILVAGIIFTSFFAVNPSFAAGYIQKNTVICLSKKDMQTYIQAIENNEKHFVSDLFDNASCYTKKREIEASYLSEVDDLVEVRTIDGFKVWLPSNTFISNVK